MNLFVKGFDPSTRQEELEQYFREFGAIQSIKIIPESGRAMVCYQEREGAKLAKE